MHSSRMRTVRLLLYLGEAGGGGVSALGGVCSRGVSAPGEGGWSAPGGVCFWGVCHVTWKACWGYQTNPLYEQNSWHTLLKILPCLNSVAGGNNRHQSWLHRFHVPIPDPLNILDLVTLQGQIKPSHFADISQEPTNITQGFREHLSTNMSKWVGRKRIMETICPHKHVHIAGGG